MRAFLHNKKTKRRAVGGRRCADVDRDRRSSCRPSRASEENTLPSGIVLCVRVEMVRTPIWVGGRILLSIHGPRIKTRFASVPLTTNVRRGTRVRAYAKTLRLRKYAQTALRKTCTSDRVKEIQKAICVDARACITGCTVSVEPVKW